MLYAEPMQRPADFSSNGGSEELHRENQTHLARVSPGHRGETSREDPGSADVLATGRVRFAIGVPVTSTRVRT
jgi:hypothetical protein